MKAKSRNVLFIIVFFFGLNLVLGSQSHATDTVKKPDNGYSNFSAGGVYLGLFGVQSRIKGDFNDESLLFTNEAIYNVPKVKNGNGFGVALGGRSDTWAYELNYFKTNHKTKTLLANIGSQDASFSVFDIDFKFDLTRGKLRPYWKFGFGRTSLTIDNNKINIDGKFGSETFRGYCFNFGGGMEYFITNKWAIDAGIVSRLNKFKTVEGVTIEDSLSGNGANLLLGMAYLF
jgi:opacity protein-like surface antigen